MKEDSVTETNGEILGLGLSTQQLEELETDELFKLRPKTLEGLQALTREALIRVNADTSKFTEEQHQQVAALQDQRSRAVAKINTALASYSATA